MAVLVSLKNLTELAAKAACPRCGYGLRGIVESWKDSCLLKGTCSECGLQFEWAELLSSKLRKPEWCVEYGRWGAVPWRALLTLVAAMWPPYFWRALKMTHRPRWGRLAAFFVLLVGPFLLTLSISHGFYGWRILQEHDQNVRRHKSILQQLYPNSSSTQVVNSYKTYSVILHFMAFPFSDQPVKPDPKSSAINRTVLGQSSSIGWPMPSPREVMFARFRLPSHKKPLVLISLFPILLLGLFPVGFVLLPKSRRIARVRWQHIARITLYGMLIFWVPLLTLMLAYPTGTGNWSLQFQTTLNWLGLCCFIAVPAALFVWWRYAIGYYLKMPHARGISASVLAMSMFLLFLCGYFSFCLDQWPGFYLRVTGQY